MGPCHSSGSSPMYKSLYIYWQRRPQLRTAAVPHMCGRSHRQAICVRSTRPLCATVSCKLRIHARFFPESPCDGSTGDYPLTNSTGVLACTSIWHQLRKPLLDTQPAVLSYDHAMVDLQLYKVGVVLILPIRTLQPGRCLPLEPPQPEGQGSWCSAAPSNPTDSTVLHSSHTV